MPIYCEMLQLVVPKKTLQEKYSGGLEKFKEVYSWGSSLDHEDLELISKASM